jgi:glycerophosphoryl diester phosphodiesterase
VKPLAIAHRAGNSLAGLHSANEVGADVIEADLHEHRGRVEVRHLKTAGPLPFLWDRWELVSASAPRLGLAELLEADRHGTTFMLDLKGRHPRVAHSAARLLHDVAHDRPLLACSRYWPSVEALADLPYVRPVLSARTRRELTLLERRLASGPPAYGVSVHRSLLDRDTVASLHRHVDVVMTWPVNDVPLAASLLEMGVTGIITDELDVLRWLATQTRGASGQG